MDQGRIGNEEDMIGFMAPTQESGHYITLCSSQRSTAPFSTNIIPFLSPVSPDFLPVSPDPSTRSGCHPEPPRHPAAVDTAWSSRAPYVL